MLFLFITYNQEIGIEPSVYEFDSHLAFLYNEIGEKKMIKNISFT